MMTQRDTRDGEGGDPCVSSTGTRKQGWTTRTQTKEEEEEEKDEVGKGWQVAAGAETSGEGGDVLVVYVQTTSRLNLSYIIVTILTRIIVVVVALVASWQPSGLVHYGSKFADMPCQRRHPQQRHSGSNSTGSCVALSAAVVALISLPLPQQFSRSMPCLHVVPYNRADKCLFLRGLLSLLLRLNVCRNCPIVVHDRLRRGHCGFLQPLEHRNLLDYILGIIKGIK